MKLFVRFSLIVVIAIAIISLSSCSKKSYPNNTGRYKHHTSVTASAVTPKKEPLRKKYIIPKKKKRVLGTDYH